MAQFSGGPWLRLDKLIELFTAMGCTVGELPHPIHFPDGERKVRYLYSPETDGFVSLSDFADDEYVPPSEVENWERRLGVTIPKGNPN